MVKGRVAKIESMGLLDGPGIRTVVFMQGCLMRCAYCHNPTMLGSAGGQEHTPEELIKKIIKYKSYYGTDGGVTVSGGEPLLQWEFLIEFFKLCKENNIHTCLDTSAAGNGDFDELLKYVDLVLLDIKHTDTEKFKYLTLVDMSKTEKFRQALDKSNAKVWIRQVILPGFNDNVEYVKKLADYLPSIKNIERVDFLPYHTMAVNIYKDFEIPFRLDGVPAMDKEVSDNLYQEFLKYYKPNNIYLK